MEINIKIQIPKDSKFIESLLLLLLKSDVEVQIDQLEFQQKAAESPLPGQPTNKIADKLYGIISLPADFDYKSSKADELLKKHA